MKLLSPVRLFWCLLAAALLSMFLGLMAGPQVIWPWTLLQEEGVSNLAIVERIRLPRVLLAATVGAGLATAGVMMQGLFRNPLADPSLIGVTSGASAGASFAIVLGGSFLNAGHWLGLPLVSVGAFLGATIATSVVYQLARGDRGASVITMLLAGIAISAIAAACNSFFTFIADTDMLRQISLWQMGTLAGANMENVLFAAVFVGTGIAVCLPRSRDLNALLLGESEARHLGVDVGRLKRHVIVVVALIVGVCVSIAGVIAFVGLMTPHMVRLVIGPDHRHLLPCSVLAGGIFLILADAVSRTLLAPSELPIGVITSLLGGPFFLWLLSRRRFGMDV